MPGSNTHDPSNRQTGTVRLSIDSAAITKGIPVRGIILADVRGYNITIKGQGLATINDTIKIWENNQKVYSLEVVNNVIVIAEPITAAGSPVVAGIKLYGYGNVSTNSVTIINVSWRLTPVGRVLDKLNTLGYNLASYNPTVLQTAVTNAANNDVNFNTLAIDVDKIAASIQSNASYAVVDKLNTGVINGTVNGFSADVLAGAKALINEPFAKPVYITNNAFTFTNIAPGTWRITLSDGLKGSADVTVNKDGTIANTVSINSENKTPVIYGWHVTALTDNGVQKGLASAFANDEDGIADLDTVKLIFPDTSALSLKNDGTSCIYDTISADKLFEGVTAGVPNAGTYSLQLDDGDKTVTESAAFTFSYLSSPVISGITEGQILTNRRPAITWGSVTGATYYDLFIYRGSTIVLAQKNLTGTSYNCTADLADGDYTIRLYAAKEQWPVNDNLTYEPLTSLGLRTLSFRIQVSGMVNIDMGELRYGYFNMNNTIYKVDFTKAYGTPTAVYTAPYVNTLMILGTSPCGQSVLFAENDKLLKIKENGSGKFLLYSEQNEQILNALWSPAGDKIAFASLVDGDYNKVKLCTVNTDGSGLTTIEPSAYWSFVFSPDGSKIYFQKRTGSSLYTANVDGTGLTEVANNPLIAANSIVELSPDKDKILLAGNSLCIYNLTNKTIIQPAIDNSPYFYNSLHWTPDNRLIYTSYDRIYFIKPTDATWTNCKTESVWLSNSYFDTTIDAYLSPSCKKIYAMGITDNYTVDGGIIASFALDGSNSSTICQASDKTYGEFFLSSYTW